MRTPPTRARNNNDAQTENAAGAAGTPTAKSAEDAPAHDIVTFPALADTVSRTPDFSQLTLSKDIKDVFRYAIEHCPTPLGKEVQRSYWSTITKFARFAEVEGVRNTKDLNTECVGKFQQWLNRQTNSRTGERWSQSYRGRQLIQLKLLVRTVKEGKPELLPNEIIFPPNCYPEGTPLPTKRKRHLTRGELTSLMWACQQEIRENKHRFYSGRRILAGEEKERFKGMRHALLTAERLMQTGSLTKKQLVRDGVPARIISKLGHMHGLRSHLAATPRTLVPLLISIMTQLAGNVEAIRKLDVNCMRTDEIDERWAQIEWDKPRAGPAPEAVQRKFRDRTKRYGAPALIAMVRAMTEPLRKLANTDDSNRLFICHKSRDRRRNADRSPT